MLKTPYRALPGYLRRPAPRSAVGLSARRPFRNTSFERNNTSETKRHSRTQEQRNNPVFLASALSATATTIGGTLLYTIVSHEKEKDDESQYANRAEMESVRQKQ
jgi:D-lactate dehydrogenase (cytochrome)